MSQTREGSSCEASKGGGGGDRGNDHDAPAESGRNRDDESPQSDRAAPRRPNIVLIITDQERSHQHWPPGWAEENLTTHYDRLIGCSGRGDRSSVVFPNAFTATTECSPSRASLLTSSYPTEHGVKTTPGALDPRSDLGLGVDSDGKEQRRPNLLRLLSGPPRTGKAYDVGWKGKWHLSPHSSSAKAASMLNWYGATSPWNPPDAGHSLWHSSTLGGGGKYNHDGRFLRGIKRRFESASKSGKDATFVEAGKMYDPYFGSDSDSYSSGEKEGEEECIFDFLAKHTVESQSPCSPTQPFFLIASLVNPHDVWASPCFSHLTDDEFRKETGYDPRDFETLPIDLPPNHKDDLSSKPLIQSMLRGHRTFGDLSDEHDETEPKRSSDALRYVRFYAYLHKLVDAEIGSLLDALDSTGQMDNTFIVRMADHGELALSHGLREKRMQCYEETMGIPMVINYPSGWFDDRSDGCSANGNAHKVSPRASKTHIARGLVSSIDILPTIAELARIDCSRYRYRGKSLVPYLRNANQPCFEEDPEDEILFTFDEPLAPPGIPGFVRCIRALDYKYAVYFTCDGKVMEYELYDLEKDPYEMANLCGPNVDPHERWHHYHERLTLLMKKMGAVPLEFDWENMSLPKKYSWG